jgi:leucyl aminopeptidase (aminopeptidase T)
MSDLVNISKRLLVGCLGAKPGEKFLVLTDYYKEDLAEHLYKAAKELGLISMLFKIPALSKSGEEPSAAAAEAMKNSDVVVCITEHSLTHTRAKKDAAAFGTRIATMPGITKEMFLRGAVTADYSEVEKLTKKIAEILTLGSSVVTIHVAFGSNNTFGGKVSAGVHIDAVVLEPTVYVDNRLIMDKGRLVI